MGHVTMSGTIIKVVYLTMIDLLLIADSHKRGCVLLTKRRISDGRDDTVQQVD